MLIAVDKPSGITSYDVIRALKDTFPAQKIGHSGTLDPLATGLMILGVGAGTKLLHIVQGQDKSYNATIDFSQISDTRDTEYRSQHTQYELCEHKQGVLINNQCITAPSVDTLETMTQSLVPDYKLPLPPFSAKKKGGKKGYELARQGKATITEQIMHIDSIEITHYQFPLLQLYVSVGSGTYIRSIAYRLGKQYGLGGIITQLRRTRIGEYHMDNINFSEKVVNKKGITIYYGKL